MSAARKARIAVDAAMLVALFLLMAYSLVGEVAHEVAGVAMVCLVVAHHALNRRWYAALAKGRYSALRVLVTATNVAMVALLSAQAVSGVMVSHHLFAPLGLQAPTGAARLVHLCAPYWLFVAMSFHLGLHVKSLTALLGGRRREKTPGGSGKAAAAWACRACVVAVCAYGAFAFVKRMFPDYLFLRVQYAFFDFSEPLALFMLDYLAVMVLFATAGYCLANLLKRNRKQGI